MEAEQNWDTYGVGGTCVYGTQNIFVGDVDRDSALEIVTGGFAYGTSNGSGTVGEAPLKVWSWNGHNVTLKASANWVGNILCLYAADVDGDQNVEIITAGFYRNETGNYTSCLRIWQLNNQELRLRATYEGVSASSIFVNDVDSDGTSEIVTVGRLRKNSLDTGQLCLWHFQDNKLSLIARMELDSANVTSANSVCASDLDNDGKTEIIVGGYSDNLNNSKGQLSLWQWNIQDFFLEANENWQLTSGICAETIAGAVQGNTIVNNAKAFDLDGDGFKEIVTGGFSFNNEKVNAQLGIWRWDGNVLARITSQEWATDYLTEIKSTSLNDVDNDGKTEIVTSGIVAAENSFKNSGAPHDRGQLTVWAFNGTSLILEQSTEWTFDEGTCAWNVGNGDVDGDGVIEIITVGCTALGSLCDPDMRIWSLSNASPPPSYSPYALTASILIALALISTLVFAWRRKKNVKTESRNTRLFYYSPFEKLKSKNLLNQLTRKTGLGLNFNPPPPDDGKLQRKSKKILLTYEDDGVGINKKEKAKLFSEDQTSDTSRGHGLFLIKNRMGVYNWTIKEEGKPGKGVKFTITIPK